MQTKFEDTRTYAFLEKLREQDFEITFEQNNNGGANSATTEFKVSGINYYLHTKYVDNPADKADLFCEDGKWVIDYANSTYTENYGANWLDPALPDNMRKSVEQLLFMFNEGDLVYDSTGVSSGGDSGYNFESFLCDGAYYNFYYDGDSIIPSVIQAGTREIMIKSFTEGCGSLTLPEGLTYAEPQDNPATY